MTLRTLTARLHTGTYLCLSCNHTGRRIGPCGTDYGVCRVCHGTGRRK